MKTTKLQEAVIVILAIAPLAYLAFIYSGLPDQVPMHFNSDGVADRMGDKKELWLLAVILSIPMYLLFKYLPQLDPKKQLRKMGFKYYYIRLAITVFITAISVGIVYTTATYNGQSTNEPNWVFIAVGLLFIVLGNFMPAMKPNYFVGIRTPWTLENETVWRKTHRLGAWAFILCGMIIAISTLLWDMKIANYVVLISIVSMFTILIGYSYITFKKLTS